MDTKVQKKEQSKAATRQKKAPEKSLKTKAAVKCYKTNENPMPGPSSASTPKKPSASVPPAAVPPAAVTPAAVPPAAVTPAAVAPAAVVPAAVVPAAVVPAAAPVATTTTTTTTTSTTPDPKTQNLKWEINGKFIAALEATGLTKPA